MRADTITFTQNCILYNTNKSSKQLPVGLLHPLLVPHRPWSHIAIDFITDLPKSNGHTTILTGRVRPGPSLCLGCGQTCLVSSTSTLVSPLATTFNPVDKQNASIRKLNATVLLILLSARGVRMESLFFWAEYAQNSLLKQVTGMTPFQCILGYQPPFFPWSGDLTELPSVNSWLQKSEEVWDQAHAHLLHAIRRQKELADRHRQPNPDYVPGQWVWLSTWDLCLRLPCKKHTPRYVGPFRIIKQIAQVSFCIDLPANYRISPTFHVLLLKPACGLRVEEEGQTSHGGW